MLVEKTSISRDYDAVHVPYREVVRVDELQIIL